MSKHDPDRAAIIELTAASQAAHQPRVVLLTTRGATRTIGQVLADVARQLEAGITDTASENITLHTAVPPGSILQIYCGPTRQLSKRQPPRPA